VDAHPSEPRQRWRLVVARDAAARDLLHRDVAAAWEAALLASGLPVSMSEAATRRPRIAFAAPAPLGVVGERELIDVVLDDLVLMSDVRAATQAAAPTGYRLVDLFDVWVSGPTLASLVTAGDYRAVAEVEAGEVTSAEIANGVAGLLAAPVIERVRRKGQGDVMVDIRPHLVDLRLARAAPATAPSGAAGTPFELWMRLRLGGEGGVGRPEEIVAALGERLGRALATRTLTRERIVLSDDPES
jgi:radical SAM-linked protein